METLGWVTVTVIAAAMGFALGYWFGYRCGQHDAENGVGEL